jgi:8-oxo-dGTP pyrophosphatase MutT (NUDIX family)
MVGGELPDTERVQREIEEQEFARGHIPEGSPPVEPRSAATICVARSTSRRFEVLLLERPLESRFAAGAHVFPGGIVDPEDSSPEAIGRVGGGSAGEPQAVFAALREAFEETGLLPAAADASPAALMAARARRESLLDGSLTFVELLAESDVRLDASTVVYFSRWITPVQFSRRYDTRFFLGRHPGGEPELTREHTAFAWLDPADALARFAAGRLPMLFPTRTTLELLDRFSSLDEVFRAFQGRTVKPILAELIFEAGRIRPAPVVLE